MRLALPSVQFGLPAQPLAARPRSLEGATVGFLDGWGFRQQDGSFTMYPLMEDLASLLRSGAGAAGHLWFKKPKAGSPPDAEQFDELRRRCQAAVVGICLSGGCTAGAIADALALEKSGIPTATLCHAEFERAARGYAVAGGLPDLPLVVYPAPAGGNISRDPRLAGELLPQILIALSDAR